MSHVTQYFGLGMGQSSVDFVDVRVDTDVPVFIDPTSLRNQQGSWAEACVADLQTYFSALIDSVARDDLGRIRELIYPLTEPNETHLGLSVAKSQGRSLGDKKVADALIGSLRASRAATTGLLTDLEDSALFVKGVDKDIVSDITTCVIRAHLVEYTQTQCEAHGIDVESQYCGKTWDGMKEEWGPFTPFLLPRADDQPLLLVPKSIVRVDLTVDSGKYYRGYLRPYYEDELLANPKIGLVRTLKSGKRKVSRKALDAELGTTKKDIERNTERFPQALAEYKADLKAQDPGPISDDLLAQRIGSEVDSLREILDEIRAISPGKAGANPYHRSVAKLLTGLFGGSLGNQRIEYPIHDGMKRIDITYDNIARSGLFEWLGRHHAASMVVVECKNYGNDAANPEFDQLAMRFSPHRGRIGILACRGFSDKSQALQRAKNIANDHNGFILVLDDADLEILVDDYEKAGSDYEARNVFPLLRKRFDALI